MITRKHNQLIARMKSFVDKLFCLTVLSVLCLMNTVYGGAELGRGWNDNIDWVTVKEGAELSKTQNKPLMIVIHKSWCGACRSLKPRFASSEAIQTLSGSFVMVNTLDEEEPDDSKYTPDGGYIPRILFFDPSGTLLPVINERGSDKYKYYYSSADDIVESMERALKSFTSSNKKPQDEL